MRILLASSEVFPFSKTGGLADVAAALPKALVDNGHEVLVISPWYKTLKSVNDLAPLWIGDVSVPFAGGFETVGIGELQQDGVRYAFIGHSDFDRDSLYGFEDDTKRFALFSRAIPQVAERVMFAPDVVHANDWHSAYLPMILKHGWHLPEGFIDLPTVFTVHNVQHQGVGDVEALTYDMRLPTELEPNYFKHFGTANAMQAALGFSDWVTTVSPTYAEELKTEAYGYGLDGTFRHIEDKFSGILNGIDIDIWNPATDDLLKQNYSLDSSIKESKTIEKIALSKQFGLSGFERPDFTRPLLAVVSRLAEQKGLDIFLDAVDGFVQQGWNIMILGSGDVWMEEKIPELSQQFPERIGYLIGYDEALAHRIYAGADALAIPSRFEPCGLTQLIAMRYGTLPIARATGGLKDTIQHAETGFLFDHMTVEGLLWASQEAVQHYGKATWSDMIKNAMKQDFSWKSSALAYEVLYQKLCIKN